VTDDTSRSRWEAASTMTTPIVTENPLRLAPVERDPFADQAMASEPITAIAPTRTQIAIGSTASRR
jgi:hypothetical protein